MSASRVATVAGRPARGAADREPIDVAVDQPIDFGRAPRPSNAAEQLVFAQVYETLVRVDCTGSLVPGLAESWRRAEDDGGWLFTLRPGARFHDGSPVTAKAVGESLVETGMPAARRERPHAGSARIASVSVLSDDVLRVDLGDSGVGAAARGPISLASPELAIGKAVPNGWPLGSGSHEIADATTGAGTGGATVELRPARWAQAVAQQPGVLDGAARLPLRFRVTPGGDPRNALDVGADVLVTANPDVIDYALARGTYVAAPLPWDAAYVLFTPIASAGAAAPVPRAPVDTLGELARDAVPGAARASSLDTTWTCAGSRAQPPRARGGPRIVFLRGDGAAAGLAERLVALGRTDRAGWIGDVVPAARAATLTVAPLSAAELGASLRAGRDAAYVIRVDLRTPAACPQSSGRVALRAVPLVDTRKTAILHTGLVGVAVDGEGTLDFAAAWWRAEPETRR